MKKIILLLIVTFLLFAKNVNAQFTIASDNAGNYSTWTNGSNLGYGFNSWDLWLSGTSGWFLGSATAAGFGDIDTNSKSFGLWGNPSGSNYSNAQRVFTNWTEGATFSIDLATAYRNGTKGIDLFASGFENIWNFNIGSDKYTAGGVEQTSWSYSQTSIFKITATQSGSDIKIDIVRGSDTYTTTINNKTLYAFHLYCGSTNAGSDLNNLFFNNLKISYSDWSKIPAGIKVEMTSNSTINSNKSVADLIINSGVVANISAANQLTVTNSLTNNGTLNLLSDATGTATLLAPTPIGTGIANVNQYLSATRNWYVSSPVSGASAPSGFTYYQRDEAGSSWITQPFTSGKTFIRGKGYVALPSTAGSTLTFSGKLNMADTIVALTWSGSSSKGFNLIGNPYPSHLTWSESFVDANASLIDPSIYYRTNAGGAAATNNNHQWSTPTFNASTGASVGGATGIIPPMQAVWVRAVAAGNLTLDNTKLARSHQSSNPMRAPLVVTSKNLRLVLSDNQSNDEILIYFNANASNDFDRFDSPKMMNGSTSTVPDMYTQAGAEQLVINGLKDIPYDTEIPLYFKANASTAASYSLTATEISNFEAGTPIYIKNKLSGEQQIISDGTPYTFTLAAIGSDPAFSIIIKAPGSTTGGCCNPSEYKDILVYKNANNQVCIDLKSELNKVQNIAVYNTMGQRITETKPMQANTILNVAFETGVYFVKLNIDNKTITRKVIVK